MGNVVPRIWDDRRFMAIKTDFGQLVFLHLLTREHGVPGLHRLGLAGLAESMHREERMDEMRTAFQNLIELELVEFDNEYKLIRVPKAPFYNPPSNPNHVTGWYRKWLNLPDSPLRYAQLPALLGAVTKLVEKADNDKKRRNWAGVWTETFAQVLIPTSGTKLALVSGHLNDSGNDSENGWGKASRTDVTLSPDQRSGEIGRERDREASEPGEPGYEDDDPDAGGDDDTPGPVERIEPTVLLPTMGDPVEYLWDLQAKLRDEASPRSKRLPLTRAARERVKAILAEGYSVQDCEDVLRVYAQEATEKKTIDWFDGVTNWVPKNFARAHGRSGEPRRSRPRDVRRGALQPAKPAAFGSAPRKANLR